MSTIGQYAPPATARNSPRRGAAEVSMSAVSPTPADRPSSTRLTRRNLLWAAVVSSALPLLAACSSTASPGSAPAANSASAPTSAPAAAATQPAAAPTVAPATTGSAAAGTNAPAAAQSQTQTS